MSTCRCYIMGKIQKYEVLTMEISEELDTKSVKQSGGM